MTSSRAGARAIARRVATRATAAVAISALLGHAACSDDDVAAPPAGSEAGADTAPPNDTDASDGAAPCLDDQQAIDCAFDAGGGDAGSLPGDLRCTGLYACWNPKQVAPTAQTFTPGVELWSDGAEKSRWISIPPGMKIDVSKHDGWKFPPGTKVWKEFKIGGKRIETRIWQKFPPSNSGTVDSDHWEATVYRWSEDGESAAKRLDNGELVNGYEIPKVSVCIGCHRGRDDVLLGVEEWALSIATAKGLTTTKMKELGLLQPVPTTTTLAIPEDGTGKAAAALGWLHENCGMCHNDRTGQAKSTGLFMDLAWGDAGVGVTNSAVYQTAVNVPSTNPKYASFTGFNRITPHDATKSLIPTLDQTRSSDGGIDLLQMPPILSRKVDPNAARVSEWINALP